MLIGSRVHSLGRGSDASASFHEGALMLKICRYTWMLSNKVKFSFIIAKTTALGYYSYVTTGPNSAADMKCVFIKKKTTSDAT